MRDAGVARLTLLTRSTRSDTTGSYDEGVAGRECSSPWLRLDQQRRLHVDYALDGAGQLDCPGLLLPGGNTTGEGDDTRLRIDVNPRAADQRVVDERGLHPRRHRR